MKKDVIIQKEIAYNIKSELILTRTQKIFGKI